MNTLIVPFLADLDTLEMCSVSMCMSKLELFPIDVVDWPQVYSYKPEVHFSVAYSSRYIYVHFNVKGEGMKAVYTVNQSPVCKDSCVEFFLRVPGDDEYWNFEFNPIGTMNSSHRLDRHNSTKLTEAQIVSIKRYASAGNQPFEERPGVHQWTLTAAIPFELLGIDSMNLPDHIMGNFYKCGDDTSKPHYLSWNKINLEKPDFHCPQFFGKLLLEKKKNQ